MTSGRACRNIRGTFGPPQVSNTISWEPGLRGISLLGIMEGVAETRRKLVAEAAKAGDATNPEHSWNTTIAAHRNIVETSTVMGEDIELPEFRAAMSKQVQKYTDQFLWGPASCNELYRIPERFSDVF